MSRRFRRRSGAGGRPAVSIAGPLALRYEQGRTMQVLFFDIDGTLIDAQGAGRHALERVLRSEFGLRGELRRPPFAGRTDRAITFELLAVNGIEPTAEAWRRCLEGYVEHLPACLHECGGLVLPGVHELLRRLAGRTDVALGLITGNLRRGARLKLAHFGLDQHFAFGGYGDDHADRDEVARAAVDDAGRHLGRVPRGDRMWVLGDTPHDVRCGRAIGARVVAVKTGFASAESLAEAAPDHLVDDFRETDWLFERLGAA